MPHHPPFRRPRAGQYANPYFPQEISGTGDLSISQGSDGAVVEDHRPRGHWAKITGAPTGTKYPHQSVRPKPDGTWEDVPTTNPDWPSGTATVRPAVELNGRTDIATGTIVWLEPDPVMPGFRFAVGGGGSDWFPARITARTAAAIPNTPPLYSGEEVELVQDVDAGTGGDQVGWQTRSGGVTFTDQGIRMPSKDYDEDRLTEVLIPIPVGQVVLARQSSTYSGFYELVPWGGLKKTTIEHIYRVCTQCVNVSGTYKMRTKMAIRKLSEYSRDRRTIWQPPATGEFGIDNNTNGTDIPGS